MSDQRGDGSAARPLRLVTPDRVAPLLPLPGTPLVGRTDTIERVRSAILEQGRAIVTLVGTGGVGKTRVAVEAVHRLWDKLPNATLYVGVRALRQAGDVPALIARTAGWTLSDETAAEQSVVQRLNDDVSLLVLDNGEQIEGLAALVSRLARDCPALAVIVTSRRALGVAGEVVVPVEPLAAPDGDEPIQVLTSNEAVALLVNAARQHGTRFDLTRRNAADVVELCRRLDGLPLALELAAARLRVLAPREMIGLLDRRFEVLRSRTTDTETELWATIDWSYRLLDPVDQQRFRALGVFPDSFQVDAAAHLLRCDTVAILDTLETLLDHHLVQRAEGDAPAARFTLLETLREFARAELINHGELPDTRDAHAEWCREFVRGAGDEVARQVERFAELDVDSTNLDAAIEWSLESGNAARVLEFGNELWRYWASRGQARRGWEALEQALTLGVDDRALEASGLRSVGELAFAVFDLSRAATMFEGALDRYTELGHELGVAEAQNSIAYVLREQGELARAEQMHLDAAAVFQRLGSLRNEASARNGLAAIAYLRGDAATAVAAWERTLEICLRLGDVRSQAAVAGNVGIAWLALGDYGRALAAYEQGIAFAREYGDASLILTTHLNRAEAAITAGELDVAKPDLDAAGPLADAVGMPFAHAVIAHHRALICEREGALGDAIRSHVDGLGLAIELGHPLEATQFVEHLAMLAAELGDAALARRAFAAARFSREATGSSAVEGVERWAAAVRADDELAPDVATPIDAARPLLPDFERFAVERTGVHRAVAGADRDAALAACGLSAREIEVARLVAEQMTDREIAAELFIGVRTVGSHVSAVLRKLGVASRRDIAQLVRKLDP